MNKKRMNKKIILPIALLMMLEFWVGCSMWSRHEPEVYGEKNKGTMEESMGNMQKVMGMDMQQRKAYMMEQEKKAVQLGDKLFHDASLGSNGQNCASCHPGGRTTGGEVAIPKKMGHGPYKLPIPSLIGAAARFPKYKVPNDQVITLEMMDNNCIRMFMKGKRLPLDSPESYYLAMYVTSLSNNEDVMVGNKK